MEKINIKKSRKKTKNKTKKTRKNEKKTKKKREKNLLSLLIHLNRNMLLEDDCGCSALEPCLWSTDPCN